MFILVSYDIADNRRRRQVFKLMKGYGVRVQYSVFECLLTAAQVQEMKGRVKPVLDQEEDSVRYYLLCETCRDRATIQGTGAISKEKAAVFA